MQKLVNKEKEFSALQPSLSLLLTIIRCIHVQNKPHARKACNIDSVHVMSQEAISAYFHIRICTERKF